MSTRKMLKKQADTSLADEEILVEDIRIKFDLDDYATTHRATRDAYVKARSELVRATAPYQAAQNAFISGTRTYIDAQRDIHIAGDIAMKAANDVYDKSRTLYTDAIADNKAAAKKLTAAENTLKKAMSVVDTAKKTVAKTFSEKTIATKNATAALIKNTMTTADKAHAAAYDILTTANTTMKAAQHDVKIATLIASNATAVVKTLNPDEYIIENDSASSAH